MRLTVTAAAALAPLLYLPSIRDIRRLSDRPRNFLFRASASKGPAAAPGRASVLIGSGSNSTAVAGAAGLPRGAAAAAADAGRSAQRTMSAFDAEQEAACAAVRLAARLCQVCSHGGAPCNEQLLTRHLRVSAE